MEDLLVAVMRNMAWVVGELEGSKKQLFRCWRSKAKFGHGDIYVPRRPQNNGALGGLTSAESRGRRSMLVTQYRRVEKGPAWAMVGEKGLQLRQPVLYWNGGDQGVKCSRTHWTVRVCVHRFLMSIERGECCERCNPQPNHLYTIHVLCFKGRIGQNY